MKLFFLLLTAFPFMLTAQTKYAPLCGNTFCVDIPSTFKIEEPYDDNNLDHETYIASINGYKFIEINGLLASRFDMDISIENISDWYQHILKIHPEITYKMQKDNWFVVSGVDPESGNIYYWKKIWEGEYVRDLYISYPKSRKSEIEPFIGTIAKSFTSN